MQKCQEKINFPQIGTVHARNMNTCITYKQGGSSGRISPQNFSFYLEFLSLLMSFWKGATLTPHSNVPPTITPPEKCINELENSIDQISQSLKQI